MDNKFLERGKTPSTPQEVQAVLDKLVDKLNEI